MFGVLLGLGRYVSLKLAEHRGEQLIQLADKYGNGQLDDLPRLWSPCLAPGPRPRVAARSDRWGRDRDRM
jgi:hypothetical protein